MSLREYKRKRRFDATPEPQGKKERGPGPLRFVVQKHEARRLHYDFRLELDGVLKSWAVPKGPSLDPNNKRLAVMVEDHPLGYRTFEGVIPEGNYGAGTVIIWDEGTYEAPNTSTRAESEEAVRAGLAKGHVRVVLHGHKLKGEFSLVKLKRGDKQNEWLLFKRTEPDDSPADRADAATPTLTHLDKVYWPDEGYTKKDLIGYYRDVAPIVLPYLRDRPESLHRHPNGISAASFFQKDVSKQPPPAWVETVTLFSKNEEKDVRYILCQNEATLLYLANLGCIELNPFNSRLATLDRPDYVVLDLDPVDVPREQLVEAALAVRKVLDRLGADSVCKTSGKRGLHIYVPLGARYDYDQARQFAELVAKLVNQQLPAITSILRSPALRPNRVYLDFLQNRRGQTLAAPYSLRPVPGATVSTPLKWSEVNKRLDPTKFTIRTTRKRLDRVGDLWRPVLGEGIDLEKALRTLSEGAAAG
jgi:bifunctional non-homologous end joining protein LigD